MWGQDKPYQDGSGSTARTNYTPLYDSEMLDQAIKHWVNILKAAPTSSRWEQAKIDQVATETAISELSRRSDLGITPPPISPIPTAPATPPPPSNRPSVCDITQLATYVPAHVAK